MIKLLVFEIYFTFLIQELLPTTLPCQVEILKLLFDDKTNTSHSPQGINIRVPGFGSTHTVEYIDDSWEAFILGDIGSYAHQLVEGNFLLYQIYQMLDYQLLVESFG